jgi:hypothetical protein
VLLILAFVIVVWLMLSNVVARVLCKVCTEPDIERLFIDETLPTPELNKGAAGAETRRCWRCCACLCCADRDRVR